MNKRLVTVFCSFALAAVLLFLRVGSISTSAQLAQTATAQSSYSLTFGQTRGMIYDCRMLPLVDETEGYIAACLPTPENMSALLHSSAFVGDVSALMESGRPFLVKCLLPEVDIPGVKVFPVRERTASGQLARHIVGYTDSDGAGLTGMEKAFNTYLSKDMPSSSVSYEVDGTRAPLPGVEPEVSLAPEATKGVVLTIDKRVQEAVEKAGSKYLKKGAVVVMEPATGKIRGIASFPQYDTTNLAAAVKDEENIRPGLYERPLPRQRL